MPYSRCSQRRSLDPSNRSRPFVSSMEQNHGQALRRFLASRMRHAAADVPDLVQEVYLRLLRIPSYESIRNPRAYLYTIASHVLHQYCLRQSTDPRLVDQPTLEVDIAAAKELDPAEITQLEQRFEALGAGLEALSPRAYITLMMYRCEGATLGEIGSRLGVSDRMAKKYL